MHLLTSRPKAINTWCNCHRRKISLFVYNFLPVPTQSVKCCDDHVSKTRKMWTRSPLSRQRLGQRINVLVVLKVDLHIGGFATMGASLTTQKLVMNVTDFVTGQKRKICDSDDEESKVIDIAMHTPKRWWFYIYKNTCFIGTFLQEETREHSSVCLSGPLQRG